MEGNWLDMMLDIVQKGWGILIAMMWGWWEWKRRKGKAAKDNVDTINYLLKSVEDLSRKYDQLIIANTTLREEVATLKSENERLRSRIRELEKPKDNE